MWYVYTCIHETVVYARPLNTVRSLYNSIQPPRDTLSTSRHQDNSSAAALPKPHEACTTLVQSRDSAPFQVPIEHPCFFGSPEISAAAHMSYRQYYGLHGHIKGGHSVLNRGYIMAPI